MFKKLAVVVSALLLSTSAVQAADYKIDFSLSGFGGVQPGIGAAPFSTASGSIVFSAASATSDWDALKSFSLTIGNVSYSLPDVEIANYGYYTNVGGIANTENNLQSGTNDFAFSVFHDDGYATLTYSSVAASGYWWSSTPISIVPQLTAQALPQLRDAVLTVPEPETYAMLLAGLGLMGAVARRRRKA